MSAVRPVQELKMWLAVRRDIEMSPGKLATQAGHAYQLLTLQALAKCPERLQEYTKGAIPKITVRADDADHLQRIYNDALTFGIPAVTITDAGRTEFVEPTLTVCAFGPAFREELPPFIRRLRLF